MVDYIEKENIRLYCGVGEQQWNHHPVRPGPYACVSPVHGKKEGKRRESRVFIPEGVRVIQDSGAFSDGPNTRLTYEEALQRQIKHAQKYRYADKVSHVASYDLLIDERWNKDAAEIAVEETIGAAIWLNSHRNLIPYTKNLILSAQGVTPQQYLFCTKEIVPYIKEGDIFGLGGWCITGKMRRKMMPILSETMQTIMPILSEYGIKQVHVWGVIYAGALAQILYWTDKYNIQLSTDSVGPTIYPAFGKWGYADWVDKNYTRPDTSIRGMERARHVKAVREWLNTFDYKKYLDDRYKVFCS